MKIILSHYDSGEVYAEVEDPTVAHIIGMSSASVILIDEKEYVVEDIVFDFNKKNLNILLDECDE